MDYQLNDILHFTQTIIGLGQLLLHLWVLERQEEGFQPFPYFTLSQLLRILAVHSSIPRKLFVSMTA